jgi:hypothetical protein
MMSVMTSRSWTSSRITWLKCKQYPKKRDKRIFQCCGSWNFFRIPDPCFYLFLIPDLRIPDPGSNNSNKENGKNFLSYILLWYRETWPGSSVSPRRAPRQKMSRAGREPPPPCYLDSWPFDHSQPLHGCMLRHTWTNLEAIPWLICRKVKKYCRCSELMTFTRIAPRIISFL